MSVYGALLARPGARALACACALGWLSFGGLMLGIVLAAEQESGSFATAGAAAGAFAAASALLAPLRGRLVDRRGTPALLACALVHAAALVAFAWVAGSGAAAGDGVAGAVGMVSGGAAGAGAAGAGADGLLVACAAAAGASAPPLIAAARALWPRVAGPGLVRTGHALNALLGDLGGVAGPAVAALLVAVADPAAAPAVLALGPLAGALLLARVGAAAVAPAPPGAARRGVVPKPDLCHPVPAHGASDDTGPQRGAGERWGDGVVRGNRGMQALLAADLVAGLALGAAEVLAPAQAAAAGAPSLAALPLMLLAAASALAALRSGRVAELPAVAASPTAAPAVGSAPITPAPAGPRAQPPAGRAARGVVLLAVALPAGLAAGALVDGAPAPLALAPLCAACLLAGVGHGRFTVALLELLDTLVPARNAVEALTWLTSAQGAGLALGAVVAGGLAS